MANLILCILTILLMIFPNSSCLNMEFRSRELARDLTEENIVRIVNDRDVVALNKLMCDNIKRSTEDLPSTINEFFDAFDGEIKSFTLGSKGSYVETRDKGRKIAQIVTQINFETSSGSYAIVSTWETQNNFQSEEMGIRAIALAKIESPSDVTTVYVIRATDGVGEWHE